MRTVLIVLLSLGAVFGISAGVRHTHHHAERHEEFKRMVATTCVQAAHDVWAREDRKLGPPSHPGWHHPVPSDAASGEPE